MVVNGKEFDLKKGMNILDLIDGLKLSKEYIVVEIDGKIIPKEDYSMILKDENIIEIVSFVGGG